MKLTDRQIEFLLLAERRGAAGAIAKVLREAGLIQEARRDARGMIFWRPTEKGLEALRAAGK